MSQEKYWDEAAGKKEFTVEFKLELFGRYVTPESRILDFGCGYGRTLLELQNSGYRQLYGIDISSQMLRIASEKLQQAEFVRSADLTIPYPDDFFDAAILLGTLTSIFGNDDQAKLIAELSRTLKPGGIIYAGDFLLNDDARNVQRYRQFEYEFNQYGVFKLAEGAVLRHHSAEYIKQLLSSFKQLHYERVVHRTMNGHLSNGFIYIGAKPD
ncbi:MAG: class I SAM-dependent methyltransferase [Victivallaceae bacterium]